MFQTCFGNFLDFLKYPGVSKDRVGLGNQGHVPKSRNRRNERLVGSHISKKQIENYKFKLKRYSTTELLSISFPSIYRNTDKRICKKVTQCGFSGFYFLSHIRPRRTPTRGSRRPTCSRRSTCGVDMWCRQRVADGGHVWVVSRFVEGDSKIYRKGH